MNSNIVRSFVASDEVSFFVNELKLKAWSKGKDVGSCVIDIRVTNLGDSYRVADPWELHGPGKMFLTCALDQMDEDANFHFEIRTDYQELGVEALILVTTKEIQKRGRKSKDSPADVKVVETFALIDFRLRANHKVTHPMVNDLLDHA